MRFFPPLFGACLLLAGALPLRAQTGCDPSAAPLNLQSTYTPGAGALLSWDAVPGSVGVRLKAVVPGGATVQRNILGIEPDQFLVPDAVLSPGTYTWWVQATCNLVPPFAVTPISAPDTFTVGGGSGCPATVTDVDGNVYPVVDVAGTCWLGENLAVTHYANGDALPTGLTDLAWQNTTAGAYAVYADLPANADTYGLLYNQYATVDVRGLCPAGWHAGTEAEWTALTDAFGLTATSGGALKETGTLHWLAPNAGATNASGMTLLPAGYRYDEGGYAGLGQYGYYWTGTVVTGYLARHRAFSYLNGATYAGQSSRPNGYPVRCVRD